MGIQGTEDGREPASSADQSRMRDGVAGGEGIDRADGLGGAQGPGRPGPLRVDAQRNLRLVLSAARDVFGEQGYGAPMEEVARRARVGVGTVYRRFPNKEALVRYIAEEETQRLTASAREALALEDEPWGALEGFVQRSAAAGTGRLLPPELLAASTVSGGAGERGYLPTSPAGGVPGGAVGEAAEAVAASGVRAPRQRSARSADGNGNGNGGQRAQERPQETRELLSAVAQLVERTRAAGELRADVTVADLMLVIATTPPRLEDPDRRSAAGRRLLEILLQGLRARDEVGARRVSGDG
jgi:AcrR family transcriptional regulator